MVHGSVSEFENPPKSRKEKETHWRMEWGSKSMVAVWAATLVGCHTATLAALVGKGKDLTDVGHVGLVGDMNVWIQRFMDA